VTILGRLRHLVRQLAAWSRPPKLIDRLAGPGSEKPKAAIDGILHLLFDDAPFGLLVIDRHGRIVRANMAIPSMVGGPVDLSRGAPASLIFAEDVRDAAWAEIAPVLAGRQHAPRSFATRLHREQVETAAGDATARVSLAVLREADGTVSGALLRISDLTHQRQLEAQLAQSQKLQAVGQLAGGIAHDFNNLLTAVLGAADSLAARDDLDAEARDDAAQISASALRGAALVRQLLAFGRQQTLQPRVVALNDAITDLSGLLRRLLGSPLRLELELEQPGHAARVDPTQFDQVLVNLAVNARDAMQDGGVLTLRTTHTTLYRALDRGPERIPPGRYVVIEVRDTGAGIPADVLPRIFDPFFTTRRGTGGHGLGLSTVHGIVHQSDGFLDVDSQSGVGTRVRVYLPRWDGDAATAIPRIPDAAPRDPSPPAGPCRPRIVLLVDDEEPVRRLAQRMLAKAGWQVLAADSAEAALALLRAPESIRPSVIVTDMVMPGMDGGALVRAVRDHLDAPDLPAILVSGYAEETLRDNIAEAATMFVPKPYSLKDLAAQLEALLPARRSVVPSAAVR
jgi:two-component system cell cycle sensor histidine kinase/response regulator CckA